MKKNLFLVTIVLFFFSSNLLAQQKGGWRFTQYSFTDGTRTADNVLMGTSSKMTDIIKYSGEKHNIEISKNRWDKKTGKLLAGVTYNVKWTDPSEILFPGEKITMKYELKTIASVSWKPDNQSVSFNQGIYGLYLLNASGENYFKQDFNADITTGKPVEKGYKNNEEKILTVNMGAGFKAIYTYVWDANLQNDEKSAQPAISQPAKESVTAWYLKGYSFTDGTLTKETVLAGTSSKMRDEIRYRGEKHDIEISKNRWDVKTGGLLAGVTYTVAWTDPPAVLIPGEKINMNYNLKTIKSKTWKPETQSVRFNQGIYGLYFFNLRGENYFNTDFNSDIVTGKPVEKGYKNNEEKTIVVSMGAGFKAVYTYQWRVY